ncbi:unnamed protein product, partial [Laminaria digitata]
ATLTFTVASAGKLLSGNADIYGLGYLSSTNPTLNSIWQLASDNETRSSSDLGLGGISPVKLVDNAVTVNAQMSVDDETIVTGASLVGFLNSMYTAGAVAGDYVIFRVNPDANEISSVQPNFRYGNSGTSKVSTLDLTVVPEISSVLLSAFGAAGLLLRRRRA